MSNTRTEGSEHKSALKWVGGKGRIAKNIIEHFPANYGKYYEPFAGGASVFFQARPKHAKISDLNFALVNYYRQVRDAPQLLLEFARGVESKFNELVSNSDQSLFYYEQRNQFNLVKSQGTAEAASLFLFLNKTAFNGLYRENSKGEFNVPFNQRSTLKIVDEKLFLSNSQALSGVHLEVAGFLEATADVGAGDLVYFDPPYIPLSKTAAFTDYTKSPFGPDAQEKLRDLALELRSKGAFVILSNSYSEEVAGLYKEFELHPVAINRLVAASSGSRGSIKEFVIVGKPIA